MSPLKDIGRVASACSHVSDTALQQSPQSLTACFGYFKTHPLVTCSLTAAKVTLSMMESQLCPKNDPYNFEVKLQAPIACLELLDTLDITNVDIVDRAAAKGIHKS